MTKEQLDAIRARFDSGLSLEYDETEALLAEVERLTKLTEETEHQMHMRIRAGYDKTVADSWRAWAEKQSEAAFKRGVAAMREAAASSLTCHFPTARTDGTKCGLCTLCEGNYAQHIRNLPAPEDK